MAEAGPGGTADAAPDYDDLSAAGRIGLLDLAFERLLHSYAAMGVVCLAFTAWFHHLGGRAGGLLALALAYLVALLLAHALHRRYRAERLHAPPDASWRRWRPRVERLALLWGAGMAVPPLLTAGQSPFEFQAGYLATIAAMMTANAWHSSLVLSVYRAFLLTGWGGVTLLVPWSFPDHWPFALPLAGLYSLTMLRHSTNSHRFFLRNIVLQEQAARALYDKNLFLTTASHDLRQPVHAMGFLVESIAQRNRDPALAGALGDLKDSVRSATQMFNALLDLSRIEAGRVQVEVVPVDLAALVDSVATVFREEARNRGLDLRVRVPAGPAVARADATMLRQSLGNLLHNALRYTRHGGILLAVRRRDGGWRCDVWDTGIGIAPRDGTAIFSPYYRPAHAWGLDSAGHGLGLAVVARCCALMGARHGFRSREGRGSCFWIGLEPAATGGGALPAAASPRAAPARAPRWSGACLVVDDDPLVRSAWQTLMGAWGLRVECVPSGVEAFGLLAQGFVPSAVFCDQRLRSGENGFELLCALLERLPEARGAMITGELDLPAVAEAEEQGYLVLRKPVEPEALRAVLDRWLGRD